MKKAIPQLTPMKSRGSLGNNSKSYAKKLETLQKMEEFLDSYELPKLTQEDTTI
jgi:hypothetical protein